MKKWLSKNRLWFGLISIVMVIGLVIFGVVHSRKDKTQQTTATSEETTTESTSSSESSTSESASGPNASEINQDKSASSDGQSSSSSNASSGDFASWNQRCPETLVVINRDNPLNRSMSIVDWNSSRSVNANAKSALNEMLDAASRDGISLSICSIYRSISEQTTLFRREVANKGGSEEAAARETARPGTSEHHTGLAVDFCKNGTLEDFEGSAESNWLEKNAYKYGFILRYTAAKQGITHVISEPWHYRYVGKDYAEKIKNSGLCLEEYIKTIM